VADSVIAVIDASKMAAPAGMSPFCDLGRVDHFVVDALTPSEHVTRLRATGAQVSVCGEGHIEVYGPPEGHSGRRYRLGFANQDDEEEFPATVRASIERAAAA